MTAPNINMFLAELLTDELVRHGVTTFCISPGSRSTPLTVAAAEHPGVDTQVIIDERASAFYAAGYARATGKAAAVICTSGTAGADMYPAVIEAWQSRLPMVILTADRPEELQNVGANQTINQEDLFGGFVSKSLLIPAPSNDFDPAHFLDKLDDAFKCSTALPLQVNCRFREPLAPIKEPYDDNRMQSQVIAWREKHDGKGPNVSPPPSEVEIKDVASLINNNTKGLIIAGPDAPFRSCRLFGTLSEKLGWPILADILSQIRNDEQEYILKHYDLYLDVENLTDRLRPDIIIHVGGLPTSKRLNRFLLGCKGVEYIKIQDHDRTIDPDHLETRRIVGRPDIIIEKLLGGVEARDSSEYRRRWIDAESRSADFLKKYFSQPLLSEPSLTYHLGKLLHTGSALYISGSMPVRDAETFLSIREKDIIVGANRGASGIDGLIASACGFAAGSGRSTILIIGDLAFIHDINSLAIAARSDIPVITIVINNNGGGIFHFLPVAEADVDLERYFAAAHGLNFKNAAELFDLRYYHPQTVNEFDDNYRQAVMSGKSAIIEIASDREQNLREHRHITSQLKNILVS